ncbi:MAG TPA: hypothetical protein VN809_02370 [Telmatospirillum sp.]|nr:hypothetical protein [Telmatospirillum sp.]
MAQRPHHRLSLAISGSPNRKNLGLSRAHHGKTGLKQLLTTWLGVVVLAVNLFGWTLTSVLPEAFALFPSDTVLDAFDDVPMCEHGAEHHRGHGGNHGKCPACFPLGNASSGALASVSPAVLVSAGSRIVERIRPEDWTAPSSFRPHRYQARAPPRFA